MNKSIKTNYILNTAYQILVLIVPLITTPYISRVLGAAGIGIYSYTYSIISYFILVAAMGTATYGQRTIAYFQNDEQQRSIKFFEILIFRLITTLFCVAIYLYYLGEFIQSNKKVAFIQIIYLLSVAFDISWFFQGMEDFKRIVFRNTIVKILNVILIFVFVKTSKDVGIYTLLLAGMTFIGNLSIWIYIPKYIQKIPLSSLKPFSNFKDIFSLFIPAIAIQVYTMLDKTMIGAFAVGNAENGYYEQAEKIVRIGLAIVNSLGTVMIPRIAKVFAEKNDRLVKEYLQKSYQFVWLLGIPLMFGIIGVSNVFVPVFFGDGYEKVKILLPIYSCIIIPVALSNVTGCQFLIPTKRQNIYTIAVTVSALFNFVLNAVLIPKYLSTGAAIATVFAELAGSTIMLVYVNYKKQIEVKKVFKLSIKNVVSGLLMLVLLLLLSNILPVNVITLGVLIVIGGSTYFISLFILKDIFFINNILSIFNKIIRK